MAWRTQEQIKRDRAQDERDRIQRERLDLSVNWDGGGFDCTADWDSEDDR
jgi:hypothetical protein